MDALHQADMPSPFAAAALADAMLKKPSSDVWRPWSLSLNDAGTSEKGGKRTTAGRRSCPQVASGFLSHGRDPAGNVG